MALKLKLRRKDDQEYINEQFANIFMSKELKDKEKDYLIFAIPRIS